MEHLRLQRPLHRERNLPRSSLWSSNRESSPKISQLSTRLSEEDGLTTLMAIDDNESDAADGGSSISHLRSSSHHRQGEGALLCLVACNNHIKSYSTGYGGVFQGMVLDQSEYATTTTYVRRGHSELFSILVQLLFRITYNHTYRACMMHCSLCMCYTKQHRC